MYKETPMPFSVSTAPPDGGKQFVRVKKTEEHFPGLKTFTFEADGVRTRTLAPARAGNYISVTAKVGDSRVTRAYTLASSPLETARDGIYVSTVKKVGILSGYLLDEVKTGDVLEVSRPDGNFVYDAATDCAHIAGVAGGAGITSLLSMAKAACEGSEPYTMTLFYCVQNAYELLFRDVLDNLDKSKVEVVYVVENDAPKGAEQGVLTADTVKKHLGDKPFTLFACGGDALYRYLVRELSACANMKNAKFSSNSVTDREVDERVYELRVNLGGSIYCVPCRRSETVMVAMERAGLGALSQCRVGECGFCRSSLVSGDYYVDPTHDRRSESDVAQGIIHPCCTYPEGNMEIVAPVDPSEEI